MPFSKHTKEQMIMQAWIQVIKYPDTPYDKYLYHGTMDIFKQREILPGFNGRKKEIIKIMINSIIKKLGSMGNEVN